MNISDGYYSLYEEAITPMCVHVFYFYNSALLMEAVVDFATRYKTQWELIRPSLYYCLYHCLKTQQWWRLYTRTLLKVHRIKYLLFHPTTLQFALKCLLWNKLLWGFLANYFHFYVALSQRWVKLQLEPFHFSKILIKVHKCYSQCNWSSPVPNKHLLSEWTSAIEVRDTPNASTSIYK